MKKGLKLFLFIFLFISLTEVNAAPANDAFLNDGLYKCIIDGYNNISEEKKTYTDYIYPEELLEIKSLDCTKYKNEIDDLTGLNMLINLNELNLSGINFIGGETNITGSSDKLKSRIILPPSLTITNKTYKIENPKIVKIENDTLYPLSGGATTVTMTGKIGNHDIKETYQVRVPDNASKNAKLASLYLSEGEFAFDSDKNVYNVVVENSVSSVKINANVLDKKAKFVEGFGPRTVKLNVGLNTLLVKVKAENGAINTYTISVTRSDGNDLNNRLINIELSVGDIEFDPDIFIYNFSVDSNVDVIDVKAVSESALAKVEVSDTKLKVGNNKITITVTSESGSIQKYELIINREDYDSTDNYLQSLNIKNYNINFNKNIFSYDLNIKNEKQLIITPVCENNEASYSIVGNNDLHDKSKIIIKVSDKEGSTREYTITVNKQAIFDMSFLDSNMFKLGTILIEFIIIIVLIIVLMFKLKNKPRKPKKAVKKVNNINKPQNNIRTSGTNMCSSCGAVNDPKSKTCYICGNLLK